MIAPDAALATLRYAIPPPAPIAEPVPPVDPARLAHLAAMALVAFSETRIAARREVRELWTNTSARRLLPYDRRAATAALLLLAAALEDCDARDLAERHAAALEGHHDEADVYAEHWERWSVESAASERDTDEGAEPEEA